MPPKKEKKSITSFHLKDCKTQNSKFILIDSKIEDIVKVSFILWPQANSSKVLRHDLLLA